MKREDKLNRHHIVPRSRGGTEDGNVVVLPEEWHAWYHRLFGNMTVDEVHEFLDAVMVGDRVWTNWSLSRLRRSIASPRQTE